MPRGALRGRPPTGCRKTVHGGTAGYRKTLDIKAENDTSPKKASGAAPKRSSPRSKARPIVVEMAPDEMDDDDDDDEEGHVVEDPTLGVGLEETVVSDAAVVAGGGGGKRGGRQHVDPMMGEIIKINRQNDQHVVVEDEDVGVNVDVDDDEEDMIGLDGRQLTTLSIFPYKTCGSERVVSTGGDRNNERIILCHSVSHPGKAYMFNLTRRRHLKLKCRETGAEAYELWCCIGCRNILRHLKRQGHDTRPLAPHVKLLGTEPPILITDPDHPSQPHLCIHDDSSSSANLEIKRLETILTDELAEIGLTAALNDEGLTFDTRRRESRDGPDLQREYQLRVEQLVGSECADLPEDTQMDIFNATIEFTTRRRSAVYRRLKQLRDQLNKGIIQVDNEGQLIKQPRLPPQTITGGVITIDSRVHESLKDFRVTKGRPSNNGWQDVSSSRNRYLDDAYPDSVASPDVSSIDSSLLASTLNREPAKPRVFKRPAQPRGGGASSSVAASSTVGDSSALIDVEHDFDESVDVDDEGQQIGDNHQVRVCKRLRPNPDETDDAEPSGLAEKEDAAGCFGQFVAESLRSLSRRDSFVAQTAIQQVLFEVQSGNRPQVVVMTDEHDQ